LNEEPTMMISESHTRDHDPPAQWDALYISMVPLPTALLGATLISDGMFWLDGAPIWARLSQGLLVGGLASGLFAAVDALLRYISIGSIRSSRIGWANVAGNLMALLLTLSNLVYRWVDDRGNAVVPAGIALSAVVMCLLLATAWLGRDLAIDTLLDDHEEADTIW
jgi:uncharacterized membrane protein